MERIEGETRTVQPPTVLIRCEPHQISLSSALEWTDEKHSLYLKSMEASFVKQLYESKLSAQRNRPSGQFKVLQGGSWNKIHLERHEFPNKAGKCYVLAADPWIRRLRPRYKPCNLVSATTQQNEPSKRQPIISNEKMCRSASSSKHIHLCHHESSRDTEVSDQNFDDEGKSETPSNGCTSKRMKTVATDTQDQVVP